MDGVVQVQVQSGPATPAQSTKKAAPEQATSPWAKRFRLEQPLLSPQEEMAFETISPSVQWTLTLKFI